jgi:hypothetical protein
MDIEDSGINLEDTDVENALFQDFGDKYIADALRVLTTKHVTILDRDMVYEAICIVVALYMKKVQDGVINQDKVMH